MCSSDLFMLGIIQTAEGLPLYHEVFEGNTAEVTTLKPVIETVVKRFPVKRVIAVADRGLLSTDNLAELQAITLPGGGSLEFILAVPGRRYRTNRSRNWRNRPLTGSASWTGRRTASRQKAASCQTAAPAPGFTMPSAKRVCRGSSGWTSRANSSVITSTRRR